MKTITKYNYLKFKPSEFIHSFLSDIEVAEKSGKRMNMNRFNSGYGYLPCLGGLACLTLGIPTPLRISLSEDGLSLSVKVGLLGDSIRLGNIDITLRYVKNLYPDMTLTTTSKWSLQSFDDRIIYGIPSKEDMRLMKRRIKEVVKLLEKYNM